MVQLIARVKGLGEIVESVGNVAVNIQELPNGIISPRDEAYSRIATAGEQNIGKSYGTRTSFGFEYIAGELPIFKRNSRLNVLELAQQAVEANRSGKYLVTPTHDEYGESFKEAQEDETKPFAERRAIVLPSRNNFEMSPQKNWNVLEFALGDVAQKFYAMKGDFPMTTYIIDKNLIDKQKGTILNQLWFYGLDDGSGFDGGRYLGGGRRARAVRAREN